MAATWWRALTHGPWAGAARRLCRARSGALPGLPAFARDGACPGLAGAPPTPQPACPRDRRGKLTPRAAGERAATADAHVPGTIRAPARMLTY